MSADYESWVCCPECGCIHLERVGVVGKRGVKDSDLLKCKGCTHQFRTGGQSWAEAHGRHE